MENNHYYQQGVRDYFKSVTRCPYSPNSDRGEAWSMGWYSAQETDEDANPINHDDADEQTLYDLKAKIAQEMMEDE